ncbi:amino acid adenylation domain-containing protein [Streptomyces sp. ML-6]|uniref:amino acid adenylation domain-containing protein n=1 Tax=Streptomyces sp. ML-6 TaxID=2982693 RepID=UPI0024BF1D97|nr:amino acid adenylation domain-containing protein [Streptomyces sp. ML-6]MDK0517996.1 amino acid adenylation domain-containing protein [Streptomyces sp. ML-6]
MFARQAVLRPDAPAVRSTEGEQLTYAELHHRACGLASRLRAAGVGPEQYVVVRMRRDPALVATLLGIMQTGAAYIAVDWNWPPARVQHIIDTAGAHLLTGPGEESLFPLLPAAGRSRLAPDFSSSGTDTDSLPEVAGTAPCTVFFTSGSTGEPKGSVTAHRAIVHRFADVPYADFGPGRVILQAAPVCWDAMTLELWSVLMNGGTSLLLDQDRVVTPQLLRELVRTDGLDTLWLTAALFNAVVDDDPGCFSGMRQVLTGGEKLSPPHIRRFREVNPEPRLVNGYGPVETAVFATTRDIADDDAERYGQIPLGTPLPHTSVHVLTPQGVPSPPGEPGEICIGGAGTSLGYLGRPELTRTHFVTLASGERVYRSGDVGRWHRDGVLLYGGRQDRQVKIRGQRVEPEELEHCLEGMERLRRAIVTVIRDPGGTPTGLAAHCLAPDGVSVDDVHAVCARELPPYMWPRQILFHDAFPLTGTGKADVRALERMTTAARARPVPAAADEGSCEGPVAACLAEARELLGCELAPDDDLVALGADSILTMRLVSRLARRHMLRIPFRAVQECRTPRAMAARAEPVAAVVPADAHTTEVTDSRLDLWLREQFSPGDPAQLIVSAFETRPEVDRRALRTALDSLTARHPALRTGYRFRGSRLHTEPLSEADIPLRTTPAAPGSADGANRCPPEWLAPFDLAHDAPARCFVTPVPGGSKVTLVIHHIAYDGWSEHVFLSEIGAAYDAARNGAGAPSATVRTGHRPPPSEAERERARAHWRRRLDGTRPLALPPGDPAAGHRLEEQRLEASVTDVQRLREMTGRDPHLAALTWYGLALHRFTGSDRFTIGSYFAGREDADENAIGYFVRPVPVTLDFRGNPSPGVVAAGAQRHWADAIAQPPLALDGLSDLAPRPPRYGLPPVFQAALAFQNTPESRLLLAGHEVRRIDVPQPAAPMPLALQIWPRPDGSWDVRLQCDPTLVGRSVLPDLADRLIDELRASQP